MIDPFRTSFLGLAVDAWRELMTTELTSQELLFNYIFRLQNRRDPEPWERVLGLAMVDGTVRLERAPEGDEQRPYCAAQGVQAALGLLDPSPPPVDEAALRHSPLRGSQDEGNN